MTESKILRHSPSSTRQRFLELLRELWLPHQSFTLLHQGSRDGMTARAFHSRCDNVGPTLTLVRVDTGHIFGGYTREPWGSDGEIRRSRHAFLFGVVSPGEHPVRFPLKQREAVTMVCAPMFGPAFGRDLVLLSRNGPEACYDDRSYSDLGTCASAFADVRKENRRTLCDSEQFTPTEVEVYSVAPEGSE